MTSALTSDYKFLTSLWSEWLAQPRWPPLDRWLKARTGTRSGHRHNGPCPHPLQAGTAMLAAMRYLQLACALETAWRDEQWSFDLPAWDAGWSPAQAKKITPLAFWYWIALRHNAAKPAAVVAPRGLRDAERRRQFFIQWQARSGADDSNPFYWLWQGMRPGWKPLLDQRAQCSGWDRAAGLQFLSLQTLTPPVWLRIQHQEALQPLVGRLQQAGVQATACADGVQVQGGKNIIGTADYRAGHIEIQDLASQQIARAVDVKPGDKVWDCCAGAGGKTLAIAAQMHNRGVVVATDLHAFKLEEIKRRAKRAAFFNIRAFPWDGQSGLRLPAEVARQGGFDRVLVDAPCSSSGTWRRNPDARWHFAPQQMNELLQLQQQLLHQAAASVRNGGYLIYATCSWCVAENEAQVQTFLQDHDNFSLQSSQLTGAPEKMPTPCLWQ